MNEPINNRDLSFKGICKYLGFALSTILIFVFSPSAFAQLTVTEAGTNAAGAALIENVFLGSCVSVSNVTYSSSYNQAVGGFNNGGTTNIGLNDGIIMTTGRSNLAIGPNNTKCAERQNGGPTDADLVVLAGATIRDRTVLEFDFIPQNDTLTFRYAFASEEYHEWVNGGYNDVFGFFISGPGIAGPFINGAVNIALIPATATPVAIDNVNNGFAGPTSCGSAPVASSGPCTNCAYFVDNFNGTTIQYDAFTRVLTATAVVTPCLTYHIKLAVGDAGDQRYDSGVFLEGGSFSAGGGVTVEIETTTIPPGIYEGCNDAWFIFRRVDGADNSLPITANFTIGGTATAGVDYSALPGSITIPAGEDSILVDINVALDFITEGNETIIVTLEEPPCACEAPGSATVSILDNDIPIALTTTGTTTICLGQSANLTANTTGSQPPYTASWNNGAPAGNNVTVSPTNTTTYTFTVTDNCGTQTITDTETITVIRPDFTVDDAQQCFDGNSFNFTNTGATGGSVTHLWNFGDGNTSTSENTSHSYASAGNYTVTHYIIFTASGCTASATGGMVVFPEPLITATVTQNVICAGGTNGAISTSVTGGTAGFGYSWNPGGQTTPSISGQGIGTYTVTVTDANGCTDSDSETIIQVDPVAPTAVCQNVTVQLDGAGNATVSAAAVNNGSSDNCGIASLVVSPNTFTCANLGANAVVLTVTDINGNTATCNATVTVQDNIAPVAVCQNITVQLNASGTATITAAQVNNGSNDNCSVSLTATPLSFTCANTGANTVVLTATDPSGNTATCNATVTIQDNIAPTAICQNITVQLDGSGNATITAASVNNGSNDNCSVVLSATPLSFTCANTGANTVVLTATDPSGNTATCNATVTIQDNIAPTAICQNITVQLDGSGNATITAASVNNGSADNCSVSLSATPLSFTCANTGVNIVVLTATDPSGNTATCNATVTVQDNIAPTAVCQNITIQLNASGNATITAAQVNNGSNDNCSVTLSATPLSFTCANTGANTVVLTATDPSGNTSTCNATVTIQDNIDPTALCQNATLSLNAGGTLIVFPTDIDNGSNDACGISGMFANPASFNCSNVGANTVTLNVTDNNGNISTCTATVTVQDNLDPTAVCQNITIQLNASGNASITAAQVNNGSNDNCSVTLTATPLSFTCANTGANTVTLTATDPSGNTDQCTATVTVQDNIDPTAICQNITVQLDGSGNATITAASVNNGSNDNCSVVLSATPLSFTCANTGTNNVTLTATDLSGNTDNCVAVVTIQDNIDPTAICQNITVQLDGSGNATITAASVNNGSNDNCSVVLSATPLSFTCANTGANNVTLTATDPSGNTDQCTATVTVQDNIDPIAVCQNITVQLDGSGNATIVAADVDNGSSDNCSVTLSATPLSFNCSNVGANTVTLTATDPSGNTDDCTATVTVQDNVDPNAVCQNITVQLDVTGNASIVAADVDGGSSDNCSVSISATPLAFTCANVGANSVTLTATDPSGNTDDCFATVTVEDNIDPTAVCQNITVQLDANGDLTILSADIDGGSADNCGIASLTIDGGNTSQDFDCSNVGANTVTLTLTDVNGNVSTCDATVTVQDNVDPTAICQNITVQLDGTGNLSITSADIDNGSTDACGIATLTIDGGNLSQDFDCSDVGVQTVTLTVTDVNGNVSTCVATVTVEDNVDPSAVCQNITVQLDSNGDASISTADINNGSSDNCGIATITLDGGAASLDFNCSDVGVQTVTLTVTDVNGNVSTCTADVTVEDNVDPTALCQNITVQLDANGDASISTVDIDNGSSDACGIATITLDGGLANLDFDCSDVGVNTVTLTVTDANGNVSTCTADVTIEDTVDPIAVCQNITVQLDATGNLTILSADIDGGSTDNCAIASLTIDGGNTSQDFDCTSVGANTVTLTVTDVNGNVSTCDATVTIEDDIDPTAVCQNITVQLDANGELTLLSADIDGGSTDNCGIASVTIDGGNTSQDFDCTSVGANTITLTVTDVNGNVSTCDATVTIEDNVDPAAVCQNITVQLDANGELTIASADIDGGSSDACGIASLTIDGGNTSQDFDCSDVGANTVTLTVTDVNGNVSTCDATVTIEDVIDPTALCQNITVQLDANGEATVLATAIDNGSTDNCGIASITLDGGASSLDFDCTNVGVNTVTLTVTDVNGNVSTCTADITIEDNIDPIAVCQNITVQLDAAGNAVITGADIDNGSADNCGVASLDVSVGSFDCTNVGVNTVTLTVTDNNGNVSTCTADVIIEDNIDPTAICQNITVQLDANGDVTIIAADVDGGSTDNCGIANLSINDASFDCNDLGNNLVTLTVTDVNGNSSTCTANVTVQDLVPPTPVCQDIIAELSPAGTVTVAPGDVDNGSFDNCAILSITLNPNSFTCAEVGFNTVTLTVTDISGNVATCTAQVDVQDNVLPTAFCQDIIVQLDGSGNATITPIMVNNGSSDACGSVTPTIVTPSAFDCSNVGVNIVTLTVEDQNGNISTCASTVTIEDVVDPIAVCQDITVQLDGTGNASISPADVDGGSSDNCAIDFMTVSPNSFTCAEEGANTVTLTVTDVNGNVSTCTATVTVENNVIPTVSCQDITIYLDAAGNASIVAADVDGGSNAACGIASLTVDPSTFNCSNVGTNTVTLTGTDNSGNVSTCTATVTVVDDIDPSAVCQDVTVQLDASGNASVVAAVVNNGSTDNCAVATLALSQTAFDCAEVGANTVTLTVTDVNGNSSTCTATVTVEDNIDPTIVCQNITVELDATGNISITGADIDNGTSDNCSTVGSTLTLDVTPGDFDCNDVGTVTVTLTATDENGNSSSCTADVTVQDNEAPIALCQDITVYLDAAGNVGITPADIDNGSSDNCAIDNMVVSPNSFTCSGVGPNPVTLTVFDVNGNVASCSSTVIVIDTINPSAVCQNITIQVDASGNASIVPSQVNNGSTDACGVASLTVDVSTFNCSVVGGNMVVLTVIDNNGNVSTCSSTVTVEDNVDPNALCQNVTVQLDANGEASIIVADIENGSTDNCAIATYDVTPNTFDCSNVGANLVALTVTDVNGNTDNCTATVTVQDNIDPTAVCQDITVQLDANGELTITSADIDGGSTDNCGIASLEIDGGNTTQDFDCSNVGTNTVTLTVTDVNGNVSTCDATVTVEDNIDPTAVCQDITVQLDANGELTITSANIDGGSTDNCGIASLEIDGGNTTQDFDCSQVGTNTVTLTVSDVNGNVSTCDATVTVEDSVDPTAVCQDITVQLDANGELTITSSNLDGGSTDNCGIASLEIDGGNTTQDFNCSQVGTNTVTLTVTDVNGNVSTCDATVTVEDNIDPTAVCQDINVQLDANGELTITSANIDGGSTDNCGIASLEIDGGNTTQDFDCSQVGTNTVTLTVTDVNGNISTCDATVTVEDNIDPTAVCQDITVQLDANGELTITSANIDGGSTDNCGIASLEIDGGNTTQDFDCSTLGTNTVTLTVTDVNGNISTCDATVTAEDNVDPVIVCQNITVQLDANGEATITGVDLDGGTLDNCSQPVDITFAVDVTDFDCSNVGVNTVTLTATDANGNVSTCSADVTVEDNVDPTAVCQDITVQLDANGDLTITSADIDGGSTDNCGVASLTIDGGNTTQDFDCSNVGTNTVTLTVTDVNGNISTCDATVTVEDNIDPTAVCQDITVQLDANGELTITSADIDGGSTDNCGIASLTIDGGNTSQDFDCSNVGTNTVTLNVTDVNGNVSTCDATVTVEDNVDPTAVCQNITVQLDANGELTITSANIDGGSTDNCGIASLEIDGGNTTQDFDCSQVGTNTVTLTVTDVNGNISTCDATVAVEDNIDPTAFCQDITVQLDVNGELTITSADIDGGSTDNCGIASLEIDGGNTTQDFDCSNVGTNTVTLTVTDVNGNVSTCDATVTVEDNVDPTAVCQDITIQLDVNGTAVLTAIELDGGSTDNCGTVTFSIDALSTAWDCSDVGTQTVTLTVTDVNGNVSTCDAQVTIENNVVPTVSCQDITVYLDATGNVSIIADDVNGGANASCGLASLTVTPNAFDCSNVGVNTVTLTATDNTGNVSTCTATVTVLDTISPTAVCQDITVDLNVNGDIIINATDLDGGSADNCSVASITVDSGQLNTTLDCSTVGTNIITVTVTDVNGNVSTCDATVTVEDNTNPTAACASVTIQLDANGEAIITPVLVDNGSSDNCGIATMSVLPQILDCNDVGANSVVLTVTDVNGNISTCVATVTAEDTISPTAVCQDITVQLTSNGTAVIAAGDIDNGSVDNCGIQSLAIDVTAFDCTNIGPNTVELTVTDVNGNVSTCTATANVVDEVDPLLACQNITVQLDANGVVTISASDVDNGSSDACGIDTMVVNITDFDCSNVGVNQVTLTVTDLYGNSDVCQASVTVQDIVPPTAVCQDITVQLDATGTATIVAADVDGGSTDNCGIDAISVDQTVFTCAEVGPNVVTLTVVDVNGNVSTCDATVTVEDNVVPTANCQDIIIYLDAAGNATIQASDINAGSDANCGIDTVFVSQTDFDCSDVGNNTVTLTVVDVNGNSSTCTANVEVLDTINPIAICQDLLVQLNNGGSGTINVAAVNNGSFDNCAIASLILDQTTFDCSVIGPNTVTLTVTDVNGNVSTCTSEVTVQDTISPNATCTPVVAQIGANGTAVILPEDVDLNSSDNCAIASLLLDQDTFDCTEIGTNTVTLTVTDASGNTSTCTALIIVEENVPPVALCQDITVYLDGAGNIAIAASDVDAGSTDNCVIDTMYVTPNAFTCSGVGFNPVVLTVVDVNGNIGSCNATVTVIDTVSPVAVCQDITVQLDVNGNATIVAEEIDNGSSDACGITQFTADITNFDCSNVGANTVVLTVEDNNGNTSSCTAIVTIEDNVPPTANCLDLTVNLDGTGTVSISAGELNDNSFDNCAIDTLFLTQNDFTCADLGENIITLTVVDANGNSDDCASVVTVLDTISPVIIGCPMDMVVVPDSSDCTPQVFWTEPTATDNCTVTLTSDFVPGDNFPVGTTTVTYTATDQSNNSVSCSFDITIQPSPLTLEPIAVQGPCGYNLSCNGAADGEATAIVSGGCMPYSYVWTNGQTTQTATGLGVGLHAVTVTDANGNSAVQTITLTQPDVLATDSLTSPEFVGGANVSCEGAADGAVNINAIGGSECVTYSFVWTGPNGFNSTDEDLTGLEAGTYVVTVTDASGCTYSDSIPLHTPDTLNVVATPSDYNGNNISCGGASDGSIDLSISGGGAPYSVVWNTGDLTEDIDSLMAGIYSYTVTDANGCTATGSVTLNEPDGLSSFIAASDYNGFNISCNGLADGSIDLTVNEGTQPYSYVWNNGAISQDLSNVGVGTYIVDIADANGCTLQDSVTLIQADSLILSLITSEMVSCNGANDGSFFVQATGGVPVLVFSWSDGQMGPTAQDIGPGSYVATVTDINGCQDSLLLQMTQPNELEAFLAQQLDVICFGESNGLVDVTVIGGSAPYEYDWSNGSIDQDLNGITAGTYVLEVTDANGCSDSLVVVINEPAQLIMTVDTVISSTCSGATDGEITVQAQGGTAPYTYTWPNIGQSGPVATGLSAGVYEVEVEDANGCVWSLNVVVGQPVSIDAQVNITVPNICNGTAIAEAEVVVSGGTSPYTYLWSDNTIGSFVTGLGAGTHSVTVTDAVGCDTTLLFVVNEPSAIAITWDTIYNVSCNGYNNGQVEVDVAGGTIPYTVSWSNGDQGYVANNLASGSITVYVTDGNGCMDSLSTNITEPSPIVWIQHSTSMVTCNGGNDGEATVLVQGGVAPYTYAWTAIGQTGITATQLVAGWYTFVATDANGCNYNDSIQITEPAGMIVTVSSDTAVCPGNGVTISASASGGAGNYSYVWDNGLGLGATHVVSPSVATTYSVQVTDQSGCPAQIETVTVSIATVPVAAFSSSSSAPCTLPTDIQFTNMSSGATGYQWLLGNGNTSTDVNPLTTYNTAGNYTVTLIASSGAGCSDTTSGTVFIDDVPTAGFTLDNTEGCAPMLVTFGNTSSIGLDYMWDFGDGTTSTLSNPTHLYNIPGEYDVTLIVSTPGGCSDTIQLTGGVSAYPSPIADFTANQVVFPQPGNEYEFVNNSVGATLYNWDFGDGQQSDEYQPTYDYPNYGGYFVTLTAINEFGCADTAVHYINVDIYTSLFVPNAMGVGEAGEASIFLPKGTGIATYHVWIFDNWGNELWESTALENGSPTEGWDGVYKGSYVPQGSYVWKINATFINGETWEGMEYGTEGKHNTGSLMVIF